MAYDIAMKTIEKIGWQFYLVNPYDHMYEKVEDLPKPSYTNQSFGIFIGFIFLETVVRVIKGNGMIRFNESLMSISHGLIMTVLRIILGGALFKGYLHIYQNYAIYELPWNKTSTWIIAALAYDFCYYWLHRAIHEVNIFWAAHQVHHSSEDYNLSTALRQSMLQMFPSALFFLPLAYFIPPPIALVHAEFNTLFQFWIHTELIKDIGPLEYILNTPSHHRVHHGSNRYCLDKNYAGVLIIWDRMFGTFAEEKKDEKIVYGLVDQPQFFNPIKHQFFYLHGVLKKAQSMNTLGDFLAAFLKGPGWFPGTSRLGDINAVPRIQYRNIYDPQIPTWANVYVLIHFIICLLGIESMARMSGMSQIAIFGIGIYFIWSLTSLGLLFDKSVWGWANEALRSMLCLIIIRKWSFLNIFPTMVTTAVFSSSFILASLSVFAHLVLIQETEKKKNI